MKFNYNLNQLYEGYCKSPSDINQHLPTLKSYSEKCTHVTEMGVREGISTTALLLGKPKNLVGYDINLKESVHLLKELAENEGLNFDYKLGDTRTVEIEETDLLFIDTWHVYEQLKLELALHHQKVKKYIILHDTTTYAYKNEKDFPHWTPALVKQIQEPIGLWPAVEEFLAENPEWVIQERFTNNNGLTILTRV